MRTKVLTAAGISALLLSGCSQAAADAETDAPKQPATLAYPVEERHLGTVTGSGPDTEAGFGAHGEVVASYLSCASEGELLVRVLNSEPVTVSCGTNENPTRTVFDGLAAGAKLTATLEAVGEPVAFELVLTDAKK
ncbi:MAG: hypothetical protein ABTA24_15175 [Arthrobacter sp.]